MAEPHSDAGLLADTNVWLWASFLIFIFILVKMGKAAFEKMLDGKIEGIRHDIENAESLRTEAQELLAQYERKHRDAVQESETIVMNAKKHADQIKKDAESYLAETVKRKEKQLEERLERMKQNAIAEIQAYASNLSIEATKEIIAEKMDKKDKDSLIDQSIKDVAKHIH